MKIGIIGTRHVHASGLALHASAHGASIIGAAESDPAGIQAWTQLGIAPVIELERLLEDADAIIVAGTNAERVDGTRAAVEAGLPVLTEKPVAMHPDDARRLVQIPADSRVSVALPIRFAGSLQRARAAIEAGAIGIPLAARGTNHGQFPGGWFGDPAEAGGGAMMDHIVHVSDGLCWLLGGDRITGVYAASSNGMYPDLAVDSVGLVTLDFASGLFASIDSSWSRPASFPTWGDVWIEIVGTEGRLVIDPMARHLGVFDDRAGKLRTVGYDDHDMTSTMVARFLDYASNGGEAPVPLSQGIHASEVVFAAYASATSGQAEPVQTLAGQSLPL